MIQDVHRKSGAQEDNHELLFLKRYMLLKGDVGEEQTSGIVKDGLRPMIGTGKNLIFIAKYHASTYDLIPLYEYLFDSI